MGQSLFSRPWKFSSSPAILTASYLIYVIFRNIKSKETRKGGTKRCNDILFILSLPNFLKKSSSSLLVFSSSSGNPLIIKAQSISQIRVQFFPIHAVFNQLPKTLNHSRFVFLIRNAKPLVLCLQHLYRTLLLPEHAADQSRKQVLCFQRIPFYIRHKESLKFLFQH